MSAEPVDFGPVQTAEWVFRALADIRATESHRRILRALRDGQWHRTPWIEHRAKVSIWPSTLNRLAERDLIEKEGTHHYVAYRIRPKGRKVLQDEEMRLYREHSIPSE